MKKLTCILLAFVLLLSLTACGGSSNSTSPQMMYAKDEAAVMEEAPAAMAMGTSNTAALRADGNADASSALPENRKWIITVDMSVETDDLDSLQTALAETIESLNGFVENQSVYNGSTRSARRYRNANLTVRIPADQVSAFTQQVGGIANVISNNLRREDVTLQYVDTEGRVKALQTEEARLLELLAAAETMSDLLEIEARLSDVRYELESYTSRLRTLDNQINYATVYLFIEEVQEYTPVEEPTFWERITEGFSDSLEGIAEGSVDLVVWVIAGSPYLVLFGLILFVVLRISKRIRIKKTTRKLQKENKDSSGSN